MILQLKRLAELTEADLLTLRDNEVPEGKIIDYKRELPGSGDGDKKEFLYDVSSFANASGGHLIYGVEEEGGIPKKLSPLAVADTEAELLRAQSLILDGVEPKIPGLELRFIPCGDSGHILVIHIPKSWILPHMVTFKGTDKFYTRHSGGKRRLDVNELRALFGLSSDMAERVKKFRIERLSQIIADELPIPLDPEPKMILHVVPLQSFATGTRIDLKAADALSGGLLFPLGASGHNRRINLDGLLHHNQRASESADSYLQLFQNGIIETVNASTLGANLRGEIIKAKLIPSIAFEKYLVTQIPKYLIALQKLGMQPPFALMLSLIGVKDFRMAVNSGLGSGSKIDRDVLIIPEIILEKFDCRPIDVKPMLDMVWNAAGNFGSPNFDASEKWIGERQV